MARILVIDDESAVRESLRHALASIGHEVVLAADGVEGMAALGKMAADLVITDLYMPNQDGVETIVEMRKSYPSIPVIAISGNAEAGNMLSVAKKLGVVGVLQKPFQVSELRSSVEAALKPTGP